MRMPRSSSIVSSHWIFDILRYLAQSRLPLGVTEVSRKLGLPVSTTQRGLATLEKSGYVRQIAPSQKYAIADTPIHLFEAFLNRFPLRKIALPYILQIAIASQETTSLWIRMGWNAVRIVSAEGPHEVVKRAPVGEYCELHESSPGLVFLSRLGKRELGLFLDDRIAGRLSRKEASGLRRTILSNRDAPAIVSSHSENGFTTAFAIVCQSEVVAAISIEKNIADRPATEREFGAGKVLKIIRQLEDVLNKHPELCRNPYAHLKPGSVNLGT